MVFTSFVSNKIIGWKGRHIGWFINGYIYDTNGKMVGYIRSTCPSIPKIEKIKSVKKIKKIKGLRKVSYIKPLLSISTSSIPLLDFLSQDS